MQTLPLRTSVMEATLQRWGRALKHAAPRLIAALLILLIAWLLAELTWAFLPRPRAGASTAELMPKEMTLHRVDANRIANQHLFGIANVGGSNLSNAPETTLALTLHGIVADKRTSESRALIVANGDEEPYAIGATLPGGAVIRAILPDKVMLARDGRMEALRLPKADNSGAVIAEEPAPAGMPGPTPPSAIPIPQNLGQLREVIAQNPQRLMDVLRIMPVQQEGKLTGYRIYPASNTPVFAELGLRPGDIVTSVNGIPLTDPAQSMRILSTIKTSEQISISLIRNGQQLTQMLQFPPGTGSNPPGSP